jgi:hypothetical protein
VRCYWEHPWGTHWEIREHIENLLGTWKEHVENKGKMKKKILLPPPPTQNLKEKTLRHFECMLSLPIGCMKLLCSKTVRHYFWPGLIPRLWTGGTYLLWAVPFTKQPLILACDAAPKLFSWAKRAYFDFSSYNFTVQGRILSTQLGMLLLESDFLTPFYYPRAIVSYFRDLI